MTTSSALAFIRAARANPALRRELAACVSEASMKGMEVKVADYAFSRRELDEAFRVDWIARWLHYGVRRAPQ